MFTVSCRKNEGLLSDKESFLVFSAFENMLSLMRKYGSGGYMPLMGENDWENFSNATKIVTD